VRENGKFDFEGLQFAGTKFEKLKLKNISEPEQKTYKRTFAIKVGGIQNP
jgi:hypothetical protein